MAKKVNQYKSKVTNEIYPGTTTITGVLAKPELMYWYGKNGLKKCQEIMEQSQEFGSRVHTIIQAHLKGQKLTLSKDEQQILDNFLIEADDVKEWLWFERDFIHEGLKYGGTADMGYVDKKGDKVLGDIKTGNRVYIEHQLQLKAYEEGLKEQYKDTFAYKVIFHLDQKTKSWEKLIINTTDEDWEVFKALRMVYQWKKNQK